ncbi:hypothetical protein BCT04_14555 [Vibrio breoganii]|uniref:hypothetical protein n=1 Tax=Vibrio breoganii TaxID=553239 RepID=UPI000C85E24D|nr:hypothetical protein [Vibrio breoganii]PMO64129.1 hypothetical protein BCT04_14555 [Vibrio breoganii]
MLCDQTINYLADYFGITREDDLKYWQKLLNVDPDESATFRSISNIGSTLFSVLALVGLVAADEKAEPSTIDSVGLYIKKRILRRLKAVTWLSPDEELYISQRLDLIAGLTFIERKLDWCVWVYRTEGAKMAPRPNPLNRQNELAKVLSSINFQKKGESKKFTFLRSGAEDFAYVVRECIASYGLYIQSNYGSDISLQAKTKSVSEYLCNSVIGYHIGLKPDDINMPRQGVVKVFADDLDRCLFDSFVYHLESNTLEHWVQIITRSQFYAALDDFVEGSPEHVSGSFQSEPNQVNLPEREQEVYNVPFRWPSTVVTEADGNLPEGEWPKLGMLKAVGYSVGQSGLAISIRAELLTNVYVQQLPHVTSQSYVDEWGAPESSRRLQKMAESLAAFARNAKRKDADMSYAIRDWEHDLAWLKDQYYLKHKYTWSWPAVKNSDEVTTKDSSPKPEKVYKSSREFLIEQYTNSAGELCCQICQSALPFKLSNGEYYWEETPIDSSLNASPFTDLVLCPNHRAMYLHANSAPNLLLESLGDTFKNRFSLKLASEVQSFFMSELHQEKLRSILSDTKQYIAFDTEQIPKGLNGVKKLYLYQKGSDWVVSSRAKVIGLQPTRMAALQWINSFDNFRNVTSTVTEKVPIPKSKANNTGNTAVRPRLSVAGVRFGSVKKSVPVSSHRAGYAICNNCNGDGGINGGCWKCGGSGWM